MKKIHSDDDKILMVMIDPGVADITSAQILLQIQRRKRKEKYTVGLFMKQQLLTF